MGGSREKREKNAKLKLKQPNRSGQDPSRQTLIDLAEQRGILKAEQVGKAQDEPVEGSEDAEPLVGRLGESFLWSISLTMLHFTLDVLVSHQYAVEIDWSAIVMRAVQAFPRRPYLPCIETLLT